MAECTPEFVWRYCRFGQCATCGKLSLCFQCAGTRQPRRVFGSLADAESGDGRFVGALLVAGRSKGMGCPNGNDAKTDGCFWGWADRIYGTLRGASKALAT